MKRSIGIIGCGPIAAIHVRALQELSDVHIVACADPDRERRLHLARLADATPLPDHQSLLKRNDIDIVVLCLPHHLHYPVAIEAIRMNKHLMIEKPLARTCAEGHQIIAACQDADLTLGVIYQNRFTTASRKLKEILIAGRLGSILCAQVEIPWYREAAYYEKQPWRALVNGAGGGVLTIHAIHMIDLLAWFLGPIEQVWARLATLSHAIEVEDWAEAWLRFESGTESSLLATVLAFPERPATLKLYGHEGTAFLEEKRGHITLSVLFKNGDKLQEQGDIDLESAPTQDAVLPALLSTEGHREEWKDFLNALQNGTRPTLDGHEALISMNIIERMRTSSRLGRPIGMKETI